MRPKSLMLLVVAVGCGLLAMWGLNAQGGGAQQEKVKVLVVAAEEGIPSNEPIKDEMVRWQEVNPSEVLWDAITRKEDYEGKALNVFMKKDEIITKSRLTEKINASTEIEIGKQVVTVNVDISTTHSGQIRPGDIVDVYTTYTTGQLGSVQGKTERKTKVVLSKIKVFSIDSIRSENTPGNENVLAKTVSLLVEPKQAEVLLMASKAGFIHLALRNKNDDTETDVPILTESDFDDINSTDQELISDVNTPKSAPNFAESELYKTQQSELEKLKKELDSIRAQGDLQKQLDKAKAQQLPTWKVKVYNGRNVDTFDFKEESDKDATLPGLQEGDSPAVETQAGGESTTSLEGDQP